MGVKRRVLLELQWRDGSGRFHHLALRPPGLRRVLGTFGVVVLAALAGFGAFSVGSSRIVAHADVDMLLRESTELRARQEALRARAFDLADELYRHVEQGRTMLWMADAPDHAWAGRCPRPPARNAGDEALFAWLSEQGTRLEALGTELTSGRAEMSAKQASAPASTRMGTVPLPDATAFEAASVESARRGDTASTRR